MTQPTAPPPHQQTKRFARTQIAIAIISVALATILGALNYFKSAVSNLGIQGTTTIDRGSAGINNGTINNGPVYNNPIAPAPNPGSPAPRSFEGGPGIPFENMEVRGVLKPANERTPPNGCDFARPGPSPDSLKVLIGDNALTHEGFGTFKAVGIGKCSALSIERRLDGIFVSASLYDSEGGAVVLIQDNRIKALNGETYTARQSQDESRLVVRNLRGTELFYVRYLNPTTLQFRGFLGCTGGSIVRVQEGQPVPGMFMSHSCLVSGSGAAIQIGAP
jgi:hypothetical protein